MKRQADWTFIRRMQSKQDAYNETLNIAMHQYHTPINSVVMSNSSMTDVAKETG